MREWGVTVLQAEAEMDAGPVWATASFPMRAAKKSSHLPQRSDRGGRAAPCLQAVEPFRRQADSGRSPRCRARLRPLMKQAERAIDWQRTTAPRYLRKIDAADGFPGVADELFGQPCHLFDAWPEATLRGAAGQR